MLSVLTLHSSVGWVLLLRQDQTSKLSQLEHWTLRTETTAHWTFTAGALNPKNLNNNPEHTLPLFTDDSDGKN